MKNNCAWCGKEIELLPEASGEYEGYYKLVNFCSEYCKYKFLGGNNEKNNV